MRKIHIEQLRKEDSSFNNFLSLIEEIDRVAKMIRTLQLEEFFEDKEVSDGFGEAPVSSD